MSTNFNILLEHKSVVAVAAEVIKGAQQEEVKRQSEIEERKQNEGIQLQDMEGKPKDTLGAPDKPNKKDQLKEERVPLIAERVALPGMISISYMAGTIQKDE